jgi:hypothetical protein
LPGPASANTVDGVLKVLFLVFAVAAYLEIGWLGVAAVAVGAALPFGLIFLWALRDDDVQLSSRPSAKDPSVE